MEPAPINITARHAKAKYRAVVDTFIFGPLWAEAPEVNVGILAAVAPEPDLDVGEVIGALDLGTVDVSMDPVEFGTEIVEARLIESEGNIK
jgi:hypothetical protein